MSLYVSFANGEGLAVLAKSSSALAVAGPAAMVAAVAGRSSGGRRDVFGRAGSSLAAGTVAAVAGPSTGQMCVFAAPSAGVAAQVAVARSVDGLCDVLGLLYPPAGERVASRGRLSWAGHGDRPPVWFKLDRMWRAYGVGADVSVLASDTAVVASGLPGSPGWRVYVPAASPTAVARAVMAAALAVDRWALMGVHAAAAVS